MKTVDLTGDCLDYWVAKAEGYKCQVGDPTWARPEQGCLVQTLAPNPCLVGYRPTTEWRIGGPIVENQAISISCEPGNAWTAQMPESGIEPSEWITAPGATPLEAAMRCYVTFIFGNEVPDVEAKRWSGASNKRAKT
ncbi:MAG: hypothetical protein A3I66_21480 [Burkholderiales bacterium RIFCSPLOWO2_02_FULL_57_36]|nr:MAG: hypothetical protein A3I66_21480 [Burkholderiales bacterium RIFCSPLOWO2_02_FULL_57_36]